MLAETAGDLVRGVLADHRRRRSISLLAVSLSNLEGQEKRPAWDGVGCGPLAPAASRSVADAFRKLAEREL
jgi:hypothetical protein